MCGLTVVVEPDRTSTHTELSHHVEAMSEFLAHRGPDSSGTWVDAAAGVALGFRRLAIIDLSQEGHQPMVSRCGRYVIVFNGEIYNHHELRGQLEKRGHRYRGHCDTEVMLSAIVEWGPRQALTKFNGMFAFALWDRQKRELTLARDRLGEKPIYYGWSGTTFLCASELKSFWAYPGFDGEVDRQAVAEYLRHGYVPAPMSIYQRVSKLEPGAMLTLDARGVAEPHQYWSLPDVVKDSAASRASGAATNLVEELEELEELLTDAVRIRMEADVPLGAFLSGGIDSSTVVALMQSLSTSPVRTFTIGFRDDAFDEAPHARAIAAHLGTRHTELYVTPDDALSVIPHLSDIYDEPHSDWSDIPIVLLARMAREQVTVALSGDGGDEVFGGYNWYRRGVRSLRSDRWPAWLRSSMSGVLASRSPAEWERLWRRLPLPAALRDKPVGSKLHWYSRHLSDRDARARHVRSRSVWEDPATVVVGAAADDSPVLPAAPPDLTEWMMLLDALTYLPGDILTKLDRATMASSLEGRVPYLDHRVVELAWRLPLHAKISNGVGKRPLRGVLAKHVPEALFERRKMGFNVPMATWLRGPLREWAEGLLAAGRIEADGYLVPDTIRRFWDEHLSGAADRSAKLWPVLMLQAWLDGRRTASSRGTHAPLAPS